MTTKGISPTKQRKQKEASRFQQLWSEAEALAKNNAATDSQALHHKSNTPRQGETLPAQGGLTALNIPLSLVI
jgi:hypothetical protein